MLSTSPLTDRKVLVLNPRDKYAGSLLNELFEPVEYSSQVPLGRGLLLTEQAIQDGIRHVRSLAMMR